jgi:hypothetical protein
VRGIGHYPKATEIAAATGAGFETTRILQVFPVAGKTVRFPEMRVVGGGGIRFDAPLAIVGQSFESGQGVVTYGEWCGESRQGKL